MTSSGKVLGIVGGTGPQGRGLAARWARAGHEVHIGSRTLEKAQAAVDDVVGRVGEQPVVLPGTNDEVAAVAEIVIVALPYAAQAHALPALAGRCAGKIVCNVANPMTFDEVGPVAVRVEAGSAGQECQQLLPDARVVSGFHDVSSRRLLKVDTQINSHVLICGDDRDACRAVVELAGQIEGMQGVFCGPLRLSEYVENITPLILTMNALYRTQAGLRIDGVGPDTTVPDVPDGR